MGEELLLLLVRAGAMARHLTRPQSEEFEVTPLELDVLRRIAARPVFVPSDSARALGVSRQHVYGLLRRMARGGLIVRRGAREYALTEAGALLLEDGERHLEGAVVSLSNVLSWEDMEVLSGLLTRLMQARERADAHRWPTVFTLL